MIKINESIYITPYPNLDMELSNWKKIDFYIFIIYYKSNKYE